MVTRFGEHSMNGSGEYSVSSIVMAQSKPLAISWALIVLARLCVLLAGYLYYKKLANLAN